MPDGRNRRKWQRKELIYPAYIVIGAERRLCSVKDVSHGGARLDVTNAADVPDDFILCLSAQGPPCRKCRVVWRETHRLGAEWVDSVTKAACEGHRCRFECLPPVFPPEEAGSPAG